LLLGILIMLSFGWLGYIIGAYIILCGIVSIFVGLMLSRKLHQMRNELHEKFGSNMTIIQEQFARFDTDGDGYIDSSEFSGMCASLGLALTPAERDYALNLLDKDKNGVIDIYEFSAWFNSRSKEYV